MIATTETENPGVKLAVDVKEAAQRLSVKAGPTAAPRSLSPAASELLHDRGGNGLPVWIRSPKTGTEFYSGFSRAKLYELAAEGKIESRSIRKPGQVKGTRLFKLQSILDFIEGCETPTAGAMANSVLN
jgi:hypothetical protein